MHYREENSPFFALINLQTYIDIALGVSGIIISTVLQIRMKYDFNYFNGNQVVYFLSKKNIEDLMKVMWALSSFILFWGLVNYICCYHTILRSLCLKVFPFSILIWCLIFGIFVFIAKANFNKKSGMNSFIQNKVEYCQNAQWTKTTFCGSDCQCYIENNDLAIEYDLRNYTTIPTNVTKIQNCQAIDLLNQTKQVGYLSYLETKFKCAGWCTDQKYYSFSDINNLVPQSNTLGCYQYAATYIDNNLYILGVFSFVVMGSQALYLLVSTCIYKQLELGKNNERRYID